MTQDPSRYWFPAKRYGWGWGFPSAWQGWVVLAAFVAAVAAPALLYPGRRLVFIATLVVASAVLICVCFKKGEPTRWRWGDR